MKSEKSKIVTLTLPARLLARARARAKADSRTFSNFVRVALIKALEKGQP